MIYVIMKKVETKKESGGKPGLRPSEFSETKELYHS